MNELLEACKTVVNTKKTFTGKERIHNYFYTGDGKYSTGVKNLRHFPVCKLIMSYPLNRALWKLGNNNKPGRRQTVIRPSLLAKNSIAQIHHHLLRDRPKKSLESFVSVDILCVRFGAAQIRI